MLRHDRWDVFDLVTCGGGPAAKVHILEPDREKILIESPQPFPNIPAKHQKSTGRLFHVRRLIEAPVQIAVSPVYRIIGPKTIDAEEFQYQGGGGREAADRKSPLGLVLAVHQLTAGQAVFARGINQFVNRGQEFYVWIKQQQAFGIGLTDTLVRCRREASVLAIGQDGPTSLLASHA